MNAVSWLLVGLAILPAVHALDVAGGVLIRVVLRRRLRRTSRGRLALTFDDGPGTALQPRLLQVLREEDVRATFHLLGVRCSVMPGPTAALLAAGHELGDHGFAHLDAWRTGLLAMAGDRRRADAAIAGIGAPVPTSRAPYGRLTFVHWWMQRRRGRPTVLWTHDAHDLRSRRPDPEAFAASVAADGGGVVLMHWHDREDPAGVEHVLAVTRALARMARREGLAVVTAAELVGDPAVQNDPASIRTCSSSSARRNASCTSTSGTQKLTCSMLETPPMASRTDRIATAAARSSG